MGSQLVNFQPADVHSPRALQIAARLVPGGLPANSYTSHPNHAADQPGHHGDRDMRM